jgi:hypothetical protein
MGDFIGMDADESYMDVFMRSPIVSPRRSPHVNL